MTSVERAGVAYCLHEYVHEATHTVYGQEAADTLQLDRSRVFKTLIAEVDGQPVVALIPVSAQLSLKALARAAGGKRASMAEPRTAERLTGYLVGRISPLGQKRQLPMFIDASARSFPTVFVSGDRRGRELELSPADLIRLTDATPVELTPPTA